ncbi:MAG: DUF4011 domain-containing anti-phage protein Hhe [Oceanisphaera sp.]|uniref:DUF4011 domain-containing anti-phage protein Hhe n=1 Tax=Oceanisphaera sp. TaxID=1929979 RepID=UPI003C74F036
MTTTQFEQFAKQVDPFILESLESMRRKLLDLTGRNRLLNFPIDQKGSSLRIINELPDQLYQTLLTEQEMQFVAVPDPRRQQLIEHGYLDIKEDGSEKRLKADPSAREWANVLGIDTSYNLPKPESEDSKPEHCDNDIQILLFPNEMETRLRGIRNKAQTAIEETGAGILYLALGFLEWFESPDSDKSRLAPLFTIPVMLERGKLDPATGVYKYQIKYTGEDIIPNLSLRVKLANDFGIGLPELDDEMLPEQYLSQVEAIISQSKPRWSVKRYASLSLLNFGKMLMYLDLDPARWPLDERNITQHPVVNRFFTSQDTHESSTNNIGIEHEIDELDEIHQRFPLIDDADSSQHSALIDAINGKHLVIEGPPGTGKSQTITNLIAAAMLSGKKVLFVAEKLAALEVVKHRLDKAGLGDFCLELHSHKSQKRKVLDEIQSRILNQSRLQTVQKIDAEVARYEELKEQLNEYAKEINQLWEATGISIHDIFSGASRYRRKVNIDPTRLHVTGLSGSELDEVKLLRLRDQIKAFRGIYSEIRKQVGTDAKIYDHPWSGVTSTDIQMFDSERIVQLLSEWQQKLTLLSNATEEIITSWQLNIDELHTLEQLTSLNQDFENLPDLVGGEYFPALSGLNLQAIESAEQYVRDFTLLQQLYGELSEEIVQDKLASLEKRDTPPEFSDPVARFGSPKELLLSDIIKSVAGLNKTSEKLTTFTNHQSELKSVLPEPLAVLLTNSKQGFNALAELISLVAELPVEIIKIRDGAFDDDELDTILVELQQQLQELLPLRDILQVSYQLDSILSHEDLLLVQQQLSNKGMFKWFNGEWRAARKSLLSMAKNPNIKVAELASNLEALIDYSERLSRLDKEGFSKTLGSHYAGMDTDVETLLVLRAWYRKVRATYGVGFGSRVAAGSALFSLDAELIKGIQQLHKQGLVVSVQEALTELERTLSPYPQLQQTLTEQTPLIGSSGHLEQTVETLSSLLESIQSWFVRQDISLQDLGLRVVQLEQLVKLQQQLKNNSTIVSLFGNSAPLNWGVNKNNKVALSTVNFTLAFARQLEEKLITTSLNNTIRMMQSCNEYQQLQAQAPEYQQHWQQQVASYDTYAEATKLDKPLWLAPTDGSIPAISQRNEKAISHPRWLNGWINFVRSDQEMTANGLEKIWKEVMEGNISIEQVDQGLLLAVYDQLAREVISARPHLARVSGISKNQEQKTFRQYDKQLQVLQRKRIASIVAQRHAPEGVSGGRKSEYTEMSLIKNELGKKSRHIPIRQLINRAGRALQELKPCFMMGPMSAAHYLQPGEIQFDLVVMDEASQVKPEDALGVITRGKQLVVVGDPKQLPPTSFFDRSDMNDEEEDVAAVIQTDSILDAALPLFPMRRLRWHYRSQHEHLIAYSNRNFYDSDLVVFPSPHAQSAEYGIKFTHVEQGRFINQHNIDEARVVAEAVAHHAEHNAHESLGIVAMNSKQREQIERAVDELCKARPEVSNAIDALRNKEDGLFIKNLENVQGDERDVIFISFTYGPAEVGGRVYQRFGPINADVGWRRLNVLFTRSKKRMHVFSSMKAEDILVNETAKRGVVALRGFLHFAEKGNMDGISRATGKAPDSDFEIAVIEALHAAGFHCEPQVGVAGFFIDIAVRDPGNPGRYLMGVECDGATYHSAKSARDRDRLRQEVLERLGWRIRRIWSTDWFSNPDGELDPIIRELNQLKTESIQQPFMEHETVDETHEQSDTTVDDKELEVLSAGDEPLTTRLARFAERVVEEIFPDTPADRRLLRPAMIEALAEHQPFSRSEFVERIPKYLRDATEPKEAHRFLDTILGILEGKEAEE